MSSVSLFATGFAVTASWAPVKVPAYTALASAPVPPVSRAIESVANADAPGRPGLVPVTDRPPFGVSVTLRPSDVAASVWRWVTLTIADLRIEPAGIVDGGA